VQERSYQSELVVSGR